MSLISELRRRNVIRVVMAYVPLAWLVVQVLDSLAPLFDIGEATVRLIVILLAIGLVPVAIASWLFELTPGGFRREREVDHSSSGSRAAARRLDRIIIGVLALAVIYFAVDKFVVDPARDAEIVSEAAETARAEALADSFGERSIAVLPFADASQEQDQEYLSDGIAEEIINLLSTVREIRVISRSSAFAFRERTLPFAEIARQLGVRYIMDGSVRRAGDRLRITAQMIDPRTDTALWSQSFDRAFGDIFAIQDEIAGEVVDRLEVELAGAKPASRPVEPPAWALYLRAANLVNKQHWGLTQEGQKLLEESLAIDAQNPAGWMLYRTILAQKVYFTEYSQAEYALEMREVVEKVLEIEPGNVEARAELAFISYDAMSTWEGSARARAYVMSLDAGKPDFNRLAGNVLRHLGQADRAVGFQEFAATRDPLNAANQRALMVACLAAGDYEAGLRANRQLREIVGNQGGLWYQGMMQLLSGDIEAARTAFDEWAELADDQETDIVGTHGRAIVHLLRGETADYARELEKLTGIPGAEEFVAILYAWEGRQDQAIDILEGLVGPPGSEKSQFVSQSPLFRGLEKHPRWDALLRKRGTHPDQVAAWGIDELFPGPGLPPAVPVEAP